jgi:hypothetical protein
MMEKRRSLSETLPPEQQEFLSGPKASRPASKPARQQAIPPREGFVAITVRLPVSLAERLQREMLTRKMAQREPASQQEIVQEALKRWLDEESIQ